jgi:hypothetical protein
MMLLLVVASATANGWYANRVAAQAERRATQVAYENELKWCSVVATMDRAYRAEPPKTATGLEMAESIAALRSDLRCPPD